MPATDRYQLLVESQTRGEAEVRRFSDALTKLADTVQRKNQQTATSASAMQRSVSTSLGRVKQDADTTGASLQRSLSNPLQAVSEQFLSGAGGAAKFAGAAAGITAAIGLAGGAMKSFIQEVSETALEIKSLSQSTGLTIGQADKLRAAANLTGFDIRNLKEAALDLSVALKDTGGQGDQTRQLLKQLGVSAYTAAGQARPLGPVLLETFEALSKISDVTTRVNLSRVLGGEDAAKNVQPLLVGLQEANRTATELGFGTRDGLLKALDESNKELKKFDLLWEVIKGKLAEKVNPIVVPVMFAFGRAANGDFEDLSDYILPGARRGGLAVGQVLSGRAGARPELAEAVRERILAKVPSGLTDFSEGSAAASRFRSGLSGSEDGINLRLEAIGKQRADLRLKLSSGDLSPTAFQELSKDLAKLTSEQLTLQRQLQLLGRARAGAEITIDTSQGAAVVPSLRSPTLFGRVKDFPDQRATAGGVFATSGVDIAAAGVVPGFDPNSTSGALEQQKVFRERERNLRFVQSELEFQVRKVELLSGPGGEASAIEQIAELKRAALQQELDLGAEIFDLNERRLQIEEERTLRLLDLGRRRRDEARGLASDLVGSVQSGNVGGFFRDQGGRLLNQIGTNALTGPMEKLLGSFGSFGANSGFGGLLKGTLFDPQNANQAVDRNTLATEANTAALTRVSAGGAIPGTGALPASLTGALNVFGSDVNGITGGRLSGFSAGLSSVPQAGLFSGLRGADKSVQLAPGFASTTAALGYTSKEGRAGNILGSAAVLGAATFGAIDGFKRGGASGNLQGVGSILGAAALIPGPQQPFVAAGALIAGFVAAALPNPKLRRDRELDRLIGESMYSEPVSAAYNLDRAGRGIDYGRGGGPRAIQVIVQTIDSKSFLDHREAISDAVRVAMYEGHSVNRAAREVVLAA